MDRKLDPITLYPRRQVPFLGLVMLVAGLVVLVFMGPFRTVPAGHVGVKDFFGTGFRRSPCLRASGWSFRSRASSRCRCRRRKSRRSPKCPSQEGLILNLETSLLFQLDPARAADIYRTVG